MKKNIAFILLGLSFSFSALANSGTVSLLNCQRKTVKLQDGTEVTGYEYKGPSVEEKMERILSIYDVKKDNYFALLTATAKVLQDIETEKIQYIATKWCELDATTVSSPLSFMLAAESFIDMKMKGAVSEKPEWIKDFLNKARLENINNMDI